MYCRNCGKEVSQNSNFCPYCGTKIGMINNLPNLPKRNTQKTSEPINWGLVTSLSIRLLLIGGFIFLILIQIMPLRKLFLMILPFVFVSDRDPYYKEFKLKKHKKEVLISFFITLILILIIISNVL